MICEGVTAFLIHSRNYNNNSQLLDFLTDEFGLIRLVGRSSKNQKTKLQNFLRLSISFSGKGELKTLREWEINDTPRFIDGDNLLFMMYINELISKLAPSDKLHLCDDYLYLVDKLSNDKENNLWQLRLFENELLEQIGYGLEFSSDIEGREIEPKHQYSFVLNKGFEKCEEGIIGSELLLVDKKIMPSVQMLQFCKQINRKRIDFLLGGRELQSRALFKKS